jgi:hypothetical protein
MNKFGKIILKKNYNWKFKSKPKKIIPLPVNFFKIDYLEIQFNKFSPIVILRLKKKDLFCSNAMSIF